MSGTRDAETAWIDYWAAIHPHVVPLETQRRSVRNRLVATLVPWFVLLASLAVVLAERGAGEYGWGLWFMGLLVGTALIWWKLTRDYRDAFKGAVIAPLVEAYAPGLAYAPYEMIDRGTVLASRLFPHPVPTEISGEDRVEGRLGATDIVFSELSVRARKPPSSNTRDLFSGLFLVADFHKHHRGAVFVLPRRNRALGLFGTVAGRASRHYGDTVVLEDPGFAEHFVARASDQVEARYVLSVSLVERIVAFRQRTGQPIMMSFVDGTLYMAIRTGRNLFEPRVFRSIDDPAVYRRFFDDIELFAGVVETLSLNTRIWTKH